MRLCYARQDGESFIGLGRAPRDFAPRDAAPWDFAPQDPVPWDFAPWEYREGWINLSEAMRDHPDRFPWLRRCPEPLIEDILAHVPDPVGTLRELVEQLESTSAYTSYQIDSPADLLSPLTRPSKIIGLGRNYMAHAEETGYSPPEEPLFFAKAPSSIVGPGADILYPPGVTRLDPEIELGIVIGRRARSVTDEEAMDYVAGYTIVNDVTARDMQLADIAEGKPWFRTKSFDTFTPTGPYLALRDEISDPHDLRTNR